MNKRKFLKPNTADETFCVLDFETTGLSGIHNRVIEVGLVKIRRKKIVETYSSFINPRVLLPDNIKQLTGISDDDLIDAPCFEDIALKIKSFISGNILVAHNLSFDYSFLANEFKRAEIDLPPLKTLCTLKLSRKLFPELKSKSLGNVVRFLKVRHKDVHRALGDSLATSKILLKMISIAESKFGIKNVNELIAFVNQNDSFGKNNPKKFAPENFKLPDNPGVYFFKDKFDKVIYIGKSKSLKQRINNHFQDSASAKSHKIVKKSSSVEFQETKTELSALIKESELIKEFNPKFNSLLKKYPQSYFLTINRNEKFPLPEVSDNFNFDERDYFGPFVRRDDVNLMIDIINKSFELRECNDKMFLKSQGCYLSLIERCIAPCQNPQPDNYSKELLKVYDFLTGNNSLAIERLINKMKVYSENKKYEEAAEIRDTIKIITNQIDRTSILKEPINKTNVIIKIFSQNFPEYLLIKEGKVFIKDFDGCDDQKFIELIDEFYNKTLFTNITLCDKDLNRIRITLSWLIKNRNCYKIYYLNNFTSSERLFNSVSY
jgi:DNA polymerase-3 subunit epsilon